MKVFVTGANGFVGSHLVKELESRNISFISATRQIYGDITLQKNWKEIIGDCDVIVHLAARVHIMNEQTDNPLIEFRKVNVEGTLNLAKEAKASGFKRFIYLSSIKVNGEETDEQPYLASDIPKPQDAYGLSKLEAEVELMKLHEPSCFEVVIIRPPLIYGPGVKANLEKLFLLIEKYKFIPFGCVNNKRSFVSVYNLCDLIINCLSHPRASGEIFLVSDDTNYSLRKLVWLMAGTIGKKPCLLPIPIFLMEWAFYLLGKKVYSKRLFGNLHLDIEKTKILLSWKPPFDFKATFQTDAKKLKK